MTIQCPTCDRLPSFLKCNQHRTEAMSTTIINKARTAGYTGTDALEAERFIGAIPVVINGPPPKKGRPFPFTVAAHPTAGTTRRTSGVFSPSPSTSRVHRPIPDRRRASLAAAQSTASAGEFTLGS